MKPCVTHKKAESVCVALVHEIVSPLTIFYSLKLAEQSRKSTSNNTTLFRK